MWMSRLKSFLVMVLIVGLGLLSGWAVVKAPDWIKSPYQEGDYSRYLDKAKVPVVLYGTSTCPYCKEAKAMFERLNVSYIEHDITQSEQGKNDFAELGGNAVPLLLIGNRRIEGFQEKVIQEALSVLNPSVRQK